MKVLGYIALLSIDKINPLAHYYIHHVIHVQEIQIIIALCIILNTIINFIITTHESLEPLIFVTASNANCSQTLATSASKTNHPCLQCI